MLIENSKSKFDELSELLSKSLHDNGLCTRPLKASTLARMMSELSLEFGEQAVESVMEWYVKFCGEPWTPKLRQSHALKRMFPKILDAYNSKLELEVSDEAKEIYESVGKTWPKGISKRRVLDFIERSLQYYRRYRTNLLKYCKNDPLLDHLLWKESEAHYFVKNWTAKVCAICWNNKKDSPYWMSRGYFLPTLSVNGLFRKLIVKWCLEFTNDMDRINRLIEELRRATA